MKSEDVYEAIRLLEVAVAEPVRIASSVRAFLDFMNGIDGSVASDEDEILANLSYDLEFFVPERSWRAEDPSYFGPAMALREINAALERLATRRQGDSTS